MDDALGNCINSLKQPPHPHDGFGGAALIGICPIYLAGCIGFCRHHHGNKPIRFLYIETSACTPKWPNPTVGKLKWFSMPHFAMATGTASPCSGSASCSTSRKSVFSPPRGECNPSHPINLRRTSGFVVFCSKSRFPAIVPFMHFQNPCIVLEES